LLPPVRAELNLASGTLEGQLVFGIGCDARIAIVFAPLGVTYVII